MALKESYETGTGFRSCYGASVFIGQTFTTTSAYSIASVELKLYRDTGDTPGTLTVEIQSTSSALPTNTVLATGTFNGNTVTEDTDGEWYSITFAVPAALNNATLYAIVLKALTANSSNPIKWKADAAHGYAGGGYVYTTDGGVSWNNGASTYDLTFRNYSSAENYDEGTLTITGIGSVELTAEIFTQLNYDEGTLEVVGTGTFILTKESYRETSSWVNIRPSDYDPDLIWDEDAGVWIAADGSGGSRLQTNLVAIGQDNIGRGVIYYG